MILSNGALAPLDSSLGDLTPSTNVVYGGSSGQIAIAGGWAAYAELYKRQLWIGVVVRKLAMATARNPFDVKLALSDNSQQPEDGPLAALMARPNPRLTAFEFWRWVSSTRDVYGEAFVWKLRDRQGVVRELYPIHPTNITIRTNTDGDLEYVFAGTRVFPEHDIIPFVSYNPDTLRRGWSNLEGLRMTLLNEDASRRATASWWGKGARPSLILSHEKNLSAPAVARLRDQVAEQQSGADNMGKPLIVEEGMQATVMQLSAEEMQYIESRKLNREEVCAAYDVPPPAVHILDKATFSNITEQLRSMYRDTMAPRFEEFESVIDHHLVSEFYESGEAFTKFNMDEVLRGDFETRATAVGTLIEKGVYRPAEARPMFNLQPAGPEADVLYGNAALVPLGSNARPPQVDTNGNVIPEPIEQPAARSARKPITVRSLMGRLSQVKAGGGDLRAKLVEEHAKELGRFFTEQRDSVIAALGQKAGGLFDPEDWDNELADVLTALGLATAQAAGTATANQLGSKFDATAVDEWVTDSAKKSAQKVNRTTADQLTAALDEADDDAAAEDVIAGVFDGPVSARSDQIATTRVAMVAGFSTLVAGQQSGAATKTWNVQSGKPRTSHAAMDGETVGINELFSNGMNAPGDPAGGADEVAGCTCGLTLNFE